MRSCLIVNPNAGSASQLTDLFTLIEGREEIVVRETASAGDASKMAGEAAAEGFDIVAAAGGDGTINEVLNGLIACGIDVPLGIIPLGTGNDLARSLGIPQDPRDALAAFSVHDPVAIDVIQVDTDEASRYAVNVAAGGFSGAVDEVLTSELKATWGPLAYLLGAVTVLPDLSNYQTTITYEDGHKETVHALNVIVANGRTAAGGRQVAPEADLCDGLLDLVIVKSGSVLELADVGTRLLTGNYLTSPIVLHRHVRTVEITSRPKMWFNVDGELFTRETIRFTVLPGAIRVLAGAEFGRALRCEDTKTAAEVPSATA